MNIEEEIFKRCHVNFKKLEEYGFIHKNNFYILEKMILNDTFKVIIKIDKKNQIKGKIYDMETLDEYTNFRIEKVEGDFVNKIKNIYIDLLMDIKNHAFENDYFISNQANRITKLIIEKYQDYPEFLWKKTPFCGVFRCKKNKKWYGIIMNINEKSLNNIDKEIDILNVKINEEKLDILLAKKGFFKAYHMNKRKWITIILNETVEDKKIMNLIDESYYLICKE